MWAGGETTTFAPLQVGKPVTRISRIENITAKQGRSGGLVFVEIRHEYHSADSLCICERQDIVFRGLRSSTPQENTTRQAAPQPDTESLCNRIIPEPLLLFRYSALTFNAHRIHYDQPYAVGSENYPGLVVHGPLQATLLFNLAAIKAKRVPKTFSYRGLAPMTLPCELQLHCQQTDTDGTVWCQDQTGLRSFSADYSDM
jgi:3-methylfumaryl-CoA hydratase